MNKNDLAGFLEDLSLRESSDIVFNQYQDKDVLNNLRLYFEYLLSKNPETLFIAEAPGYKGCRISGIPFSSSQLIKTSNHEVFKKLKDQFVLKEIISENTATIFWNSINKDYAPLVWNAFPFHTHQKNNPNSNRKPSKSEVEEGKEYILALMELFKPKKICALGRVGELTLKEMFPNKALSGVLKIKPKNSYYRIT